MNGIAQLSILVQGKNLLIPIQKWWNFSLYVIILVKQTGLIKQSR